ARTPPAVSRPPTRRSPAPPPRCRRWSPPARARRHATPCRRSVPAQRPSSRASAAHGRDRLVVEVEEIALAVVVEPGGHGGVEAAEDGAEDGARPGRGGARGRDGPVEPRLDERDELLLQ